MRSKYIILNVSILAICGSALAIAEGVNGHSTEAPTSTPAGIATSRDQIVTYEAFGAVGDGVHDDLPPSAKPTNMPTHTACPSKPRRTRHTISAGKR